MSANLWLRHEELDAGAHQLGEIVEGMKAIMEQVVALIPGGSLNETKARNLANAAIRLAEYGQVASHQLGCVVEVIVENFEQKTGQSVPRTVTA